MQCIIKLKYCFKSRQTIGHSSRAHVFAKSNIEPETFGIIHFYQLSHVASDIQKLNAVCKRLVTWSGDPEHRDSVIYAVLIALCLVLESCHPTVPEKTSSSVNGLQIT